MAWEIRAINMRNIMIVKLKYIIPIAAMLVAFPFFFLGGPSDYSSSLFRSVWECGHLIFFIALVLALRTKFDLRNWRVGIAITAAVFVGGGLIELIQIQVGRNGSWDDVMRDLTGTWLGLFWAQRPNKWVWVGRALSAALLIPNLSTVFYEARYQINMVQQFPLLAGFESSIELYGQKPTAELSAQFHTQGHKSLKLNLTTDRYSGISFVRLFNDWSGFKALSFDIYNPDSLPLTMVVRVNDIAHEKTGWIDDDRFNKQFQVNPGWNHLAFTLVDIQKGPAKRLMDLSKMSLIVIYAAQLPEARTIYVDNVRLE